MRIILGYHGAGRSFDSSLAGLVGGILCNRKYVREELTTKLQ